MKGIIYISVLVIFGCKHPNTVHIIKSNEIIIENKKDLSIDSSLYTNKDSVVITTENLDTLIYSKKMFNDIVTYFPELYNDRIENPDISYFKSGIYKEIIDSSGNDKSISFGSEAGQDEYYILYAYFLKKKTGEKKFLIRRKTLIKIYNDINDIFGDLQNGGTYFGHQYSRIPSYAEYSINWYSKDQDFFTKSYDITKQKEIYIESLQQLINDEMGINKNESIQALNEPKKELFKIVADLKKMITDDFYLKRAQEFQYSHY